MLKRIDGSKRLSNLIERISNFAARYRGLPVVIGIFLLIVSMLIQSVDVYAENNTLELAGVITHNLGILIALIGFLVAIPLGK